MVDGNEPDVRPVWYVLLLVIRSSGVHSPRKKVGNPKAETRY